MRQMQIGEATPMTKQDVEDIRAAWPSFTTLGTARWWDLGLRLMATIAEAQGKLARIEADACTCRHLASYSFGCIVHDDASVIARILRSKEGE